MRRDATNASGVPAKQIRQRSLGWQMRDMRGAGVFVAGRQVSDGIIMLQDQYVPAHELE